MEEKNYQNKIIELEKKLKNDEDFINKLWTERKSINDRLTVIEADIVTIKNQITSINGWIAAHG